MATDTTHLPQGELNTDAGNDMAGSELEFGAVQLAQVTADGGQPVQLPQGQQVVLIPVQPGQTLTLPTDSPNGLLAKIGPEGNLAIVVDGRTIIFQGYVQANDQSPVRLVTSDGDQIDVADVVAATDSSLDIQTAAGPATGDTGDTAGSGIYTPFNFGPGLGGLNAIGVLDPTALQYKLIDNERETFVDDEDEGPSRINITFDELGGIVNEDDLTIISREIPNDVAALIVAKDNGHDGDGNDEFDGNDREDEPGDVDGTDGNPDPDREPLVTIATVTVDFHGDVPGTLAVDPSTLPAGLTSEGQLIIYDVLPAGGGAGNTIVAFVDGNGNGKFDDEITDRRVFDVKVQEASSNSVFHVAFTLYDNIDNAAPDANGDGAADLLGGNEQILGLPVKVTATDSTSQSLSAVMNLGVEDDIPFFGEAVDVGEGFVSITPGDSSVTHDESWFPQPDADDQSIFDPQASSAAFDAGQKVVDAGFGLPYGDSVGSLFGIAQKQVLVSFGADGRSQESAKDADDATARNSIFGELQDRETIADGVNDGQNELPFELFMIDATKGSTPAEDNVLTGPDEGNLTIADQPTNATVTWNGEILNVFLRQIDATTIVGYVIPPEGEEPSQESRALKGFDGENGEEAVFVLTVDQDGVLTFVQYHQINHDTDGPTGPDHDDTFTIMDPTGEIPVVHVRISDYDGDHATQPVGIQIQDDGPKFCGVDWGCDNDSKYGKGLIDEDKLQPNGNNDWAPGDDKGGKHADGTINFNFGVDKPGHLEVHGLKVTDSAGVVLMDITVSYDEATDSYIVSGPNDLKTADGHPIEIEVSIDGNGLLTLVGRDSEDGSQAFVYTLQTTGYDAGEFDFCLNEPLYHPYTDSDSQNDGPTKSFEDNLKFELNVRGYDVDGDWADGNICINVDDDSPKAECDYECVVEGTHGDGELNFATGNVITGDGNTIFGNDANNLDGNADNPGADQPYTISKLAHDGVQYFLNTPEGGDPFVTKGAPDGEPGSQPLNGTTETFDPTSGILHIPTDQGGTLDIVLISDDQSEVGDYKYTVPENAQHDHDIEAGPESLADSMSEDFDEVSEWEQSFSDAGITLVASGGVLGLRDLNVSGPAYRGIGVGSGEGDNNEVDNNGPNETLTLQIANPTNNIELTIGALYNGGPDGGAMENLRWEVWNGGFLVASGEILGTETGLVTLDIDTLLPFDKVVLKPSDNGQGESPNNSDFVLVNAEICCPKDKFTEEFEYTLRDADGDEACATLKVDVKDTEPKVEHEDLLTWVHVDEDGLPKGIGNSDSPHDAPGNSASFSGTIPFTPGADPVTIELSVVGGPDTGLRTLDGQKVLATWDSVTGTLIGYIEGTDPAVAANQVFKMHITDAQTGAFEFDLLQAVKHIDNEIIANDTENLFDAFFLVKADIEDKDCDVASTLVKVVIDDDMPVIEPCHDKYGNPINLLVNGGFEQLGLEDGGTLDRGTWGVLSQIPGWTSGNAGDPSKAGVEVQNAGAVGLTPAEGNQYVELDSDALNPLDGKPASTNASIYQDVETQDGNNYVLSFSYSPRVGDPTTDGIEVWFDGKLVATIDSGKVGEWKDYTFVVEAGEADGTPDSSRIEFKAVGTSDSLGGFIDDVSLTACVAVDEDLLPNGIEGGPGDDGVIGTSFKGSLGVNFGADQGKSIEFLENGQPNLKSGGQTVKYEWVGAPGGLGTLIAYTGNNPNDVSKQVFKVEVTSLEDGGQYTFTLLKPLDHPDSNNNPADNNTDNGKGSYEDNLIFELDFKATDRDGDTVKGHLQVNVDDDSPTIGEGSGSISLYTDETLGGSGDAPGGGTRIENDEAGASIPASISGQVAGTVIGFSQGSAAGLFSGQYGADGPGTTAYALTILGTGATGLTDTATGTAITLVAGSGGVILGKNAGGDVVFAFSIDGSGNVTMVQYRAVNHGAEESAPGVHDEVTHFIQNALGVTATITDKDGDAVSLTRDISSSISIDDDGPQTNNDYDSVKEGAGNFAAGNVVTGGDAALLGIDVNLTDGTADNPGQDKPYTISKLTHDGHSYTLSADGLTVLKDGSPLVAPESFAGGKLTITTGEGGVFEIVMKSGTQSEVGEYKYTPGNPIHAEDVHVGPSVEQSNTDDFNSIGEWTSAFSTGGITLSAQGGSLTIKDVSIAGPNNDYRGVGINTGLDNGEVDTDNEKLTLTFDNVKFPGGVNNAEVQLGALFDGVQYDAGSQEIVRWEAYNGGVLVASGQIVGDFDGLVTLDIDTATNFNKIVLTPLNNGAGDNGNNSDFVVLNVEVCKQEPVCEEFGYTLRDGDGDESSATLKINVEDTYPTIPTQTPTLSFLVDEDGLPGGIGNTTSPFDADEGDAGNDDAKFSGNIPFTPGADPVTIELFVGEPGTPGGGDTGLDTVDGKNVYAAWDAATSTLIGYIQGTDPSDAANRVFTMHITNAQTGAFDFQLFKPIEHPNTDAGGANNNTENAQDPWFTVNVQIEDSDCDVAFTTVKVTIDDDMPTVEANYCGSILLHTDETLGGGADVAPNPGTTAENDEDLFDLPDEIDDIGLNRIGESQANASVLFNINPGADGLESVEYSLNIINGGLTGLIDTATGVEVRLYNGPDGTIVGRAGNSNAPIVLAFYIDEDTGLVSMGQYRAVNHGAEEPGLGNHDEVVGFTKSALTVRVVVSDKDQDGVGQERDISGMITIDDDGPKVDINLKHNAKLVLDETVGGSPNDNDEVGQAPGNDIGYAKITAGNLFTESSGYGTDGQAAANHRVFSLVINGSDVSGLVDSQTDQNIVLVNNAGVIEGRVGNAAGALAFTISVNGSGDVTVSQFRAVEHNNDVNGNTIPDNDHDQSSSPEIMDSNKLLLKLTLTDRDGDKAEDTIDLGSIIKFEDDGPKANADVDSILEDGADHAIGNVITPANVTPFGSDTNPTDGVADAPGSDGLKSITWTNVVDDAIDYVQGAYGKLYVDAAGNYKYDLDESNPALATLDNGETLQEIFAYTIKDGDDDTSGSTLTITINGKTDAFPPTAENATAFVDEDALAGGAAGGFGDNDADLPPDTVAGEAVFRDPTLPVNWNGNVGTIALSAGNWTGIKTIDGHDLAVGAGSTSTLLKIVDATTNELVLEVEIFNHTTGDYEVRLHKALSHPDSNNNPADDATDNGTNQYEDNITVPVTVTYTNIAGSSNATININVDDDSPNLNFYEANGDIHDDEGSPLPGYTGIPGASAGTDVAGAVNSVVYTINTTPGADGIDHYEIDLVIMQDANIALRATDGTADGAPIVFAFEGAEVVGRISDATSPLNGAEVLRVSLSGNQYTLTQSSPLFHTGQGEQNVNVAIGVKVVDRDGDADSGAVIVPVNDDMPTVAVSTQFPTPKVVLDETRPVGTETDGDNDPAGRATHTVDFSGNFTFAFGADGAADTGGKTYALELSGSNVASGMYALTADGIGQGTQIVLNKVGNDIVGTANGDTYFTISVDGDGKVTFTQAKNVWHADAGNDDDTSSLHTAVADALKLTLTLKDGDNDTVSASINLGHDVFQIEDDGPTANNDNVAAAPGSGGTADIVFIVDVSGSMTDGGGSIVVPGVPGFDDNRLGLARYSMQQLLLGHPEILNVQFVLFDDTTSSTVWMSRADALTYIGSGPGDGNFDGGGRTNYDIGLAQAMSAYGASVRPEGAADQTLVYFMSDGAPNEAGDPGITNVGTGASEVSIAEWESFVSNPANDISNVFALGLGGSVNAANLAPVSYPNTDTGAPGEDNVVVIPDADLTQLTQTLDDLLGTVLTPVTGDVTANDSFGTDGPANPELVSVTYNAVTYTFGPGNTEYTIDLGATRGTLKIKNDGTYTYTPPPAEGADGNPFQVEYKIRDRDGDTSTANIIIDLTTPPTTDLNGAVAGDDHVVGFTEQTSVEIAPDATIAADVASLASMTVTLTNRPDGNGVESLGYTAILPPGVTGNYNSATGVLQFTGVASVAAYQGLLQSIIYNNTSDTPNTTPRDVTVVVNDGASNSVANHVTVSVTPVNDAPDANISAPSYAATEQVGLNLHNTGLSISDVDAGNGTMKVTLSVDFGTLTVAPGNSGILLANISGSGTGSVTITGTQTQINNLLGGVDTGPFDPGTIVYNANSNTPPASAQLTLHVEDNGNTGTGGNLSGVDQVVTINIAAVNDVPVTNAGSGSGNEDAPSITVNLSGTDPEDGVVTKFKITSLPIGGTLYADAGLSNIITLNEIVNAATVFFVPTANFNGAPTFQYAAIDSAGLEDATPATATITVSAVADATAANNDSVITAINNDATFTLPHWALLANDSDADGPLSITAASDSTSSFDVSSAAGVVTVNTAGSFDPPASANFTYTAGDGNSSDGATVAVTAAATPGNVLSGTASAEIIVDTNAGHTVNAGAQNDIVFGNGGADTLNGEGGDDILVVSDSDGSVNDFTAVNGGTGIDTFRFGDGSNDRTFDLRDGSNELGNIDSIERVDMTDGFDDDTLDLDATRLNTIGSAAENSNITLTVADILPAANAEFLDDQIDLFVLGDANDHVNFPGGETFANLGAATIGGITYNIYANNVGGADDAIVAIQQGVTLT